MKQKTEIEIEFSQTIHYGRRNQTLTAYCPECGSAVVPDFRSDHDGSGDEHSHFDHPAALAPVKTFSDGERS